ncbi:MAG: PKD domain-containing protein [Bacteroidota bacterium]
MKKIALIFVLSLFSLQLFASHIVGGDIYYEYLGNNNYKVQIIVYRDCNSTGAEYDSPLKLGVYDANNNLLESIDLNFPGSVVLPIVLNNPCVNPPTGICTERAIYQTTINLPPSLNGYTLAYQRCCRGPNITNLNSPEDTGFTLATHVTGINSNAIINSSPKFTNYPPLVICNNDILNFDHSATDADGDSLAYELIIPNAGADDVNPAPIPSDFSPPFPLVSFAGGFSPLNPLGPGATISINPITGQLLADPELLGLFVVGIRVKEYRNGVLIGRSDRDFLFKVVNCVITLSAEVVPQVESSTFISFCQGFDAEFENNSFGGTNYFWDFGIDTLTTDVSTAFEPNFTFPGPGTYVVTLVVNPGWPCTDTSYQTFILNDDIDISYTVEDSMCVTGNSHDFIGVYAGPPNPEITWNFGSHGSIQTANTLNVNNVVFDTSGVIPVTISVHSGTCDGTFTDYIFLYNEPIVNFGIDSELKCAPYLAQFYDSSISYAPLIYTWSFGDESISNLKNPSHLYENPGVFDVSLSIESTEGCLAALTMTKDDLIRVYPSPTSKFSATPLVTDIFHPDFQLFDESFDSDYLEYHYDDSIVLLERNPSLSFVESGGHLVYQIVTNEFGCVDSSYQVITITPQTTLYIPNTFTPDGNKFNNFFQPIVFDALNYSLEIYNRWGELIFETKNPKEGWNGTYKEQICEDGIYTFKVKYTDIQTRETIIKTGHVNLLR